MLEIRDSTVLRTHVQRGALFENLVMAEFIKEQFHKGQSAGLYFWRDNTGHDVDLLFEQSDKLQAVGLNNRKRRAAYGQKTCQVNRKKWCTHEGTKDK